MSKGRIRKYMDIENIACLDITECGLRNLGQYFESSALSLADNNSMLYHRKKSIHYLLFDRFENFLLQNFINSR